MAQVIMNIWTSLMSRTIHVCQLSIEDFVDLCRHNELVRCLSCCDEFTWMKLFPSLLGSDLVRLRPL